MKLKHEFIITEIDTQFAAIPVEDAVECFNGIIHLNQTAKDIIELLAEEISFEGILDALSKKYTENSREEIQMHVTQFVEKLKEENLLI